MTTQQPSVETWKPPYKVESRKNRQPVQWTAFVDLRGLRYRHCVDGSLHEMTRLDGPANLARSNPRTSYVSRTYYETAGVTSAFPVSSLISIREGRGLTCIQALGAGLTVMALHHVASVSTAQ